MCGITGFIGIGDAAILKSMTDALMHRGPDGSGYYLDPEYPAALGHRRLAILDIDGGLQPMWNETATVGVVFNGEIYNHTELRAELQRKGHIFITSHSDTEVLVHGWEEWGASLPFKLNGMFSFAIWDRRQRTLFLSRDRFGEKPLYYFQTAQTFVFASELQSLILHPAVNRSLDLLALKKFFAYGFCPAPHTPFIGCRKLPAGHSLCYYLDSATFDIDAYWTFALEPDDAIKDSDEPRLVEELQQLLSSAVKRRLISDVPLGIFLSGGIDSSAVLSFAAQHKLASSLQTFTIGFREKSYDESSYARQVAEAFGTNHQERICDLAAMRETMLQVLHRMDEPLGDPSILPTYLLSAFAREKVTVALSGDGGDELFAGYDPFAALVPAHIYDALMPATIHGRIRRLVELLPSSARNMSLDFKLKRMLRGLSYGSNMRAPLWMSPLEPDEIAELFQEPVFAEELYSEAIDIWNANKTGTSIDRMLEYFTRMYLQDDILTKVDRATMMTSLESRAVFLDNDVIEFCRKLPHRFKYRSGTRKYLLKKAVAPFLPPAVIHRRKKGFGIPLSKWLRSMPAEPPMQDFPGINLAFAGRYWKQHRENSRDHRLFLWCWLAMQCAIPLASQPSSKPRQTRVLYR